jgi:uncharacterized protein (DUF427 family)
MAWQYDGHGRPPFAEQPKPGQESVWDYPRPPLVVPDRRVVAVRFAKVLLAESSRTLRVLETASAPTFYLPPEDVRTDHLERSAAASICEWKGEAAYYDFISDWGELRQVAWSYPNPSPSFQALAGYIAFYPSKLECYVDRERVRAQPGGFYGGWVTRDIAGPVKGLPGSHGW